jgi:hypothetical protein
MRRPQFSLKTMLWLMACVACFCFVVVMRREIVHRRNRSAPVGAQIHPEGNDPVAATARPRPDPMMGLGPEPESPSDDEIVRKIMEKISRHNDQPASQAARQGAHE